MNYEFIILSAPLIEKSAHLQETVFSRETLLMKYCGSFPVSEISFDDIVYRSE